jgi:hypothetical protein
MWWIELHPGPDDSAPPCRIGDIRDAYKATMQSWDELNRLAQKSYDELVEWRRTHPVEFRKQFGNQIIPTMATRMPEMIYAGVGDEYDIETYDREGNRLDPWRFFKTREACEHALAQERQ